MRAPIFDLYTMSFLVGVVHNQAVGEEVMVDEEADL